MRLWGWALIQPDWCSYKRRLGHRHTWGRPREDIGKRRPSASQRERPQKKPTLLTPWVQTSSLQNCKKMKFLLLSHPISGALLWHPSKLLQVLPLVEMTHIPALASCWLWWFHLSSFHLSLICVQTSVPEDVWHSGPKTYSVPEDVWHSGPKTYSKNKPH